MKVKDLIKQLLELKPESTISFQIADGCCGDYEELTPPELNEVDWMDGKNSHVNFQFPPLAHMSSCIASGVAKQAVVRHRATKNDIYKANSAVQHRKVLKSLDKKKAK